MKNNSQDEYEHQQMLLSLNLFDESSDPEWFDDADYGYEDWLANHEKDKIAELIKECSTSIKGARL